MGKVELTEDMKKELAKRIHRSASFQRAFKGIDGEFALKEIDSVTNYKGTAFELKNPDPYLTAYKSGQRSIAVFIHNCIEQDIDEAQKLLKEKKE